MKLCTECGTEYEDDKNYCNECDLDLDSFSTNDVSSGELVSLDDILGDPNFISNLDLGLTLMRRTELAKQLASAQRVLLKEKIRLNAIIQAVKDDEMCDFDFPVNVKMYNRFMKFASKVVVESEIYNRGIAVSVLRVEVLFLKRKAEKAIQSSP